MAYCIKCGTELITGANFCFMCGTKVPGAVFGKEEFEKLMEQVRRDSRPEASSAESGAAEKTVQKAPSAEASSEQIPEKEFSVYEDMGVPEIVIDELITVSQISNGEKIIIRDSILAFPLSIRLHPELKDGSRLRVKDARVRILNGEALIPIVICLHVKE